MPIAERYPRTSASAVSVLFSAGMCTVATTSPSVLGDGGTLASTDNFKQKLENFNVAARLGHVHTPSIQPVAGKQESVRGGVSSEHGRHLRGKRGNVL